MGVHQWYLTWWGRTYPGAIFPEDFPRGNPRPSRHAGDEVEPDTSKDLGEEEMYDQEDDAGEQEASGDGDDPDAGEGDWDGDDEEDGEEEEEDEEEEEEGEEDEEDKSDAVPHHSRDDTISLDPLSIPSQGGKDSIRGHDSTPHHPMPTIQNHYKGGEPSRYQS